MKQPDENVTKHAYLSCLPALEIRVRYRNQRRFGTIRPENFDIDNDNDNYRYRTEKPKASITRTITIMEAKTENRHTKPAEHTRPFRLAVVAA